MNRKEAAQLVAIVVTAYPNYDKFKDAESVKATVNLWAMMFADDDGGLVGLAVQKHIVTNKWPPSVAEIRELMLELRHPELVPPDTAWLAVSDLLHSAGQYNHGNLQNQLPPLVARAVESIGWGNLWEMHRSYCVGGKPGMDRVAFMQQYAPMYEREKARAMTPEAITTKIDAAAAALPDNSRYLLEMREAERRQKDAAWDEIYTRQFRALEASTKRLRIAGGEDVEATDDALAPYDT